MRTIELDAPTLHVQEMRIPKPKDVKVIIITEGFPTHLLPLYKASLAFDDLTARCMIFAASEPGRLIVRIDNFLKERGDSRRDEKMIKLIDLFHIAHLIYLPKEVMEDRAELELITSLSARKEIDDLIGQGARIVVTLGEAAQSWIRSNFSTNDISLIQLPIPSNHISDWFPNFLERMHIERGADTLRVLETMAAQIDKLILALSELRSSGDLIK